MATETVKKRSYKELVIGICVLLTILILIFGIDFLKGVNVFKAANYYYVTYHNVAGLAQSAPVTVNGFKVGVVREIKYDYDHPGNVNVELSLDKSLKVPRGSKAILATDMLGTSTIDLRLADGTDYYTVGEFLEGGQKAGLMDALGDDMLPAVKSILPKVDSLVASLASLASNPALKNSVESLDEVMANLQATSANLSRVMATMPAVATDVKETMTNARQISESATTIAGNFAEISDQLKSARLDSTLSNINALSESLADISAKLNSKESSLGMFINDPTFYNSLNASVASLDSLLQDVKRNPKRYISIKLL
ncbi:MAG: MlaD family protein [Clostridium sp.]|nr:MlaD family protein [Clostridium sp.]